MSNDTQPEIRFPGFTEDWEERKLLDIADKAVDNRGKTPTISEDGNHPLLEVASLGNGAPDYSKVTKYLSDETFMAELRAYIREGDILFSTVGSIGLVSLMDTNENAAIAQNIVAFRANEKYDSKFLYAMLSTKDNQHKAQRIVMGAVQPSIKVSQLVDVDYCVTENMEEQRKLGEYFLNLDNLITLHQRKLDLLKETKKGFLQKMFPKNGAKVPEIRFPGFTEDWEERRLNDFISGDISDGDWIEKEHIKDEGKYRIIQTGNIGNGVYIDKEKSAKYMDQNSFDILKANEIFPGDLLVSRLAEPAGRTVILPNIEDRMVTAVDVTILRQNENFDAYFLLSQMNTSKILNKVSKNVSGTSHKRISRKNLEKVTIDSTSIEEQNKIGAFFKQLDDTIALHQRKLDLLKETKKGFLQKMFI
ncbi:restriction endonuclease subunit S [Enterococcus faecalis]|uniref:restriction endonuclease subunit S n=1 Tax=Enterococcus faecalis TaxID=1351 RepID=UPI00288C9FB6|nr:restriction endonuclease subunit S [Enterococcus faecalis]MDT2175737.1 restriction endonuclease subunit S [Enterococcus faecalis]